MKCSKVLILFAVHEVKWCGYTVPWSRKNEIRVTILELVKEEEYWGQGPKRHIPWRQGY